MVTAHNGGISAVEIMGREVNWYVSRVAGYGRTLQAESISTMRNAVSLDTLQNS
jgi:hypothetical protein